MCMEDVRLARESTTTTTQVAGDSGAWVLVAPRDLDRYSLMIQWAGAVDTMLICGSNGVPTTGASLGSDTNGLLLLDLQHHGDMVTQPWYLRGDSSNVIAVVTASTLRKR